MRLHGSQETKAHKNSIGYVADKARLKRQTKGKMLGHRHRILATTKATDAGIQVPQATAYNTHQNIRHHHGKKLTKVIEEG